MLRGAYDILDTVCKDLGGITPGQTTKDGKFTVIEVECQGACSNAPMMVVGDDFYVRIKLSAPRPVVYSVRTQEDLTPATTTKVLQAFRKGEKPKPGPQSGRQTSENSAGLTALTSKVWPSVYTQTPLLLMRNIALRTRRVLYTRVCLDIYC